MAVAFKLFTPSVQAMSDEILEIGVDGTFEIPMPPPPSKGSDGRAEESFSDENKAGETNESPLEDAVSNAQKGISAIAPGGYKIYDEHDARALSIVIRFETEEERVKGCRVSSTSVEVTTSAGTVLKVPLVNTVRPDSAICSTSESVVLVRVMKTA